MNHADRPYVIGIWSTRYPGATTLTLKMLPSHEDRKPLTPNTIISGLVTELDSALHFKTHISARRFLSRSHWASAFEVVNLRRFLIDPSDVPAEQSLPIPGMYRVPNTEGDGRKITSLGNNCRRAIEAAFPLKTPRHPPPNRSPQANNSLCFEATPMTAPIPSTAIAAALAAHNDARPISSNDDRWDAIDEVLRSYQEKFERKFRRLCSEPAWIRVEVSREYPRRSGTWYGVQIMHLDTKRAVNGSGYARSAEAAFATAVANFQQALSARRRVAWSEYGEGICHRNGECP